LPGRGPPSVWWMAGPLIWRPPLLHIDLQDFK
jgi:hypothetical protein